MKTQTQTLKTDVYARVTNRIIADLEQGVRPWLKPWSNGQGGGQVARPLRHNGLPYSGINVVLLWCASPPNTVRVMNALTERPEAVTRARNSARKLSGGR